MQKQYTTYEAAQFISSALNKQYSVRAVTKAIERQTLNATKHGHVWLIYEKDLLKFIHKKKPFNP